VMFWTSFLGALLRWYKLFALTRKECDIRAGFLLLGFSCFAASGTRARSRLFLLSSSKIESECMKSNNTKSKFALCATLIELSKADRIRPRGQAGEHVIAKLCCADAANAA